MNSNEHLTQERAGCLILRRARSTKTLVGLYRAAEALMDDNDGKDPYATVCEDHGYLVMHRTRAIAESHLSHPEEWCEVCLGNEEAL